MRTKICPKCKTLKPLSTGFYKAATRYDGVSSYCMVCHREATKQYDQSDKGKARISKRDAKAQEMSRHKLNARSLVRKAVREGKLVKPEACVNCGQLTRIEGHHENYAKPLDVVWLCNICHKLRHGKIIAVDILEQLT